MSVKGRSQAAILTTAASFALLLVTTAASAQAPDTPKPVLVERPSGPRITFNLPAPNATSWPTAETKSDRARKEPQDARVRPSVGPWYVEGAYGALNPGNFTDIMFQPHKTNMTSNQIVGMGVGREVWTIGDGFSIEAGLLLNHRIDEGGVEIALPVTFVFDDFPWRDRLPMRLRLAIGPSFSSEISPTEKRKDDDNQGSKFLNMFNPEIEIGWPGAPDWTAFFRLHHRSGIFGLIDGVTGGSTYLTAGIRHRFALPSLDPLE